MRCNKVGMKTPRIARNLREIVEGECLVAVQGTDLDEDSPSRAERPLDHHHGCDWLHAKKIHSFHTLFPSTSHQYMA